MSQHGRWAASSEYVMDYGLNEKYIGGLRETPNKTSDATNRVRLDFHWMSGQWEEYLATSEGDWPERARGRDV